MKVKVIISLLFVSLEFYSFQNTESPYTVNTNASFTGSYADTSKDLSSVLRPVVDQAYKDMSSVLPGTIIGVWMDGCKPFRTTYGYANLEEPRENLRLDHYFRIGSVTKTFVGTVVLQLVQEGKLSLQDTLSKFFPNFPNGNNITIGHLGFMKSGLYSYSDDPEIQSMMDTAVVGSQYSPEGLIEIALKHQPLSPPGTEFYYNNTNLIVLGIIIEKITGTSLGAEIKKRILEPLEMTYTTFPLDAAYPEPFAHGYMLHKPGKFTDVAGLNPSWGWSAGAIISTLDDMGKFAKALYTGEKLLSPEMQSIRLKWGEPYHFTEGIWEGIDFRYGFTIADFGGVYGHDGVMPGYNTFMGYLPEKQAVIIVFGSMWEKDKNIIPADYIARKIVDRLREM